MILILLQSSMLNCAVLNDKDTTELNKDKHKKICSTAEFIQKDCSDIFL